VNSLTSTERLNQRSEQQSQDSPLGTVGPARYVATVRDTFAFLKRTSTLDQLLAKAVSLTNGWLLPLGDMHIDDRPLVDALGRWRAGHMEVFPTQFKVTYEGTHRWLAQAIVGNPDRLLLLVTDRHGRPIGHLGLSLPQDEGIASLLGSERTLEYGYLLRGESSEPGLMSAALSTALRWAHEQFAPDEIYSLTFDDNARALAFQQAVGGLEHSTIALRAHRSGDRTEYRPVREEAASGPVDKRYVVMTYPDRSRSEELGSMSVAGPSITARETAYVLDAVRTGWNELRSGYLDRFADKFAAAAGVRYALPTSSCTGAMHLALLAMGIGSGDEVVVPETTWVATANAVALTGATPVFADVEERTWCLDPDTLRAAIGPRTRAVIPVHLYGYPAAMDAIRTVAEECELFVLEDAAPAAGATVRGRPVGSWGQMAAFSFQGAKLLVTGEGGMLVSDDELLYERALHLWDQARGDSHPFWCDEITPKYKMSNVQAALGLAQLERIESLIEAKQRIHDWYREELRDVPGVAVHRGDTSTKPTHWMTSVLVGDKARISRDELADELARRQIDTRPTFPPLSTLPMWRSQKSEHPVARRIADRGLNLPSGVTLRRDQVAHVAAAIGEIVSARTRSRA
jgi:perosamine synthetase